VSYTTSGTGTGLVLVHGTSMDGSANFGHVVDRFAKERQVILPDYGGCGESAIPDGELTLDTLVGQLATVIATAGGPVDLLGDSLGAMVAAATAARYPELVRRLVLVAGWADSGDARHQLVFGTWARLVELDPELGNRYGLAMALSPGFLSSLGEDTIARFAAAAPPADTLRRIGLDLRVDIRAEARRISAPTLVIRGEADYLVPEYQSLALRELIPGSAYAEVESGHGALLERSDEVVELARRFFSAG
jgi:pimeloyl-ACP methyl ester carboxylesterase